MKFSANLGFLWSELPLTERITAARDAGFDAVECHWPYDTPVAQIRGALKAAGLPLIGLNTARGDVSRGENGLSALPGRGAEARAAIDLAMDYASSTGAQMVHVMAGVAHGSDAATAFSQNLAYACDVAGEHGITVLIEPLNNKDAPGYFLRDTSQAASIMEGLGRPNLRVMFDCYHVARTEGDVIPRLEKLLPAIGHIQIASVPDRTAPDTGTLDYQAVFAALRALGWSRPIGAEYKPGGSTETSLGWLKKQLDLKLP